MSESSFLYQPPNLPVDVVYQDKDVFVVNKPSGLLSVPGRGEGLSDSMYTRVLKLIPFAYVVHRLDMDTSGVMLFARRRKAERHVKKQFQDRAIGKRYIALVQGVFQCKRGVIDKPLMPDPERKLRHCVSKHGKPSITKYEVLQEGMECSLVKLMPITGRSHQIRVHLLSIGHPILGDRFYAPDPVVRRADRLCLHAEQISFLQPYTQRPTDVTSPHCFDISTVQ